MLLVAGFLSSLIFFFFFFFPLCHDFAQHPSHVVVLMNELFQGLVSESTAFLPGLDSDSSRICIESSRGHNCRDITESFHTLVTFNSAMLFDSFTRTLPLAHTDMVTEEVNEGFFICLLWHFVSKWIFEVNFRSADGLHVSLSLGPDFVCFLRGLVLSRLFTLWSGSRSGVGLGGLSYSTAYCLKN